MDFIKVNHAYAYRNCAFMKVSEGKITYFDPKDWLYLMYYDNDEVLNYSYGEQIGLEIRALDGVLRDLEKADPEEAKDTQFIMTWAGFHHWVAINGYKERRVDIWPVPAINTVTAEMTSTPTSPQR